MWQRRVGRPTNPTSKHFGYLEQQIMDAEATVTRLKQAKSALEEDNDRQNATLGILDSGISAADTHLSFLLISLCAFSRKTRTLLKQEDANNVSSTLCHWHCMSRAMHDACMHDAASSCFRQPPCISLAVRLAQPLPMHTWPHAGFHPGTSSARPMERSRAGISWQHGARSASGCDERHHL